MNLNLFRVAVFSAAALTGYDNAAAAGTAQEPGARRGDPALVSPEVAADRRVTFRLRAPEAKTVNVSGDFGSDTAMRKGADGIWTATVGPLDPEMYVYFFMVDGVRMTDPSNPQVKIGYVTSTTTSLFTVPGDTPAFYDVQDVPHGEIRTLLYKSRSNGVTRELTVYVRRDTTRRETAAIPCSTSCTASRTIIIRGIATAARTTFSTICSRRKRLQPFLVVMPLGYGGARVNGDGTGFAPQGAGAFGGDAALYERDLLEDIIPMIDGKYRTIADRKHRAIVGFSMGGGQAGRFGLRHLDTFSQVGIMSAGMAWRWPDTEPTADAGRRIRRRPTS